MNILVSIDILYWLALIFGLIMSISYFPQGWKQLRNKSSHNIAITTFVILLVGKIIWTFYGIQIDNFPVIISNAVSVIGLSIVVILYFVYRTK